MHYISTIDYAVVQLNDRVPCHTAASLHPLLLGQLPTLGNLDLLLGFA